MISGLKCRLVGKLQAAHTLILFVWHLRNWRHVWSAYRRGMPIASPLQFRNGLTFAFGRCDDPIQLFREIFVSRCYTPRWFYDAQPGETVLDLGANIGAFALAVARSAPGLTCHCFEPSARTRSQLDANAYANCLTDRIFIYPYALGGAEGTAELKSGESSIHQSFFSSTMTTAGPAEPVPVITLARALALCGVDKVDLLKVDIEGAELDLFQATPPEVFAPIRRVVVEYHDHFRPGARAATERALGAAGFSAIRVCPVGDGGLLYAWRR